MTIAPPIRLDRLRRLMLYYRVHLSIERIGAVIMVQVLAGSLARR
jgi:hypothetical protein